MFNPFIYWKNLYIVILYLQTEWRDTKFHFHNADAIFPVFLKERSSNELWSCWPRVSMQWSEQ